MTISNRRYLLASPGVRSERAVKTYAKFKRDFEDEFAYVKEHSGVRLTLYDVDAMGNVVASWHDWNEYETADEALDDLPFVGPTSSWALEIKVTQEDEEED